VQPHPAPATSGRNALAISSTASETTLLSMPDFPDPIAMRAPGERVPCPPQDRGARTGPCASIAASARSRTIGLAGADAEKRRASSAARAAIAQAFAQQLGSPGERAVEAK